jgi:hypothetical protein
MMGWCFSLRRGTRRAVPEWEITATTIHCDTVDDEVTILITRDATATCTGRARHGASVKGKRQAGACRDGACALIDETITRFEQ